jgi:hydroxymethylglutaryl-CoA synthase
MLGIVSYGAYVPILRLQRQAVAAAHAWYNPALRALGSGEQAMASWDEDAITMAVEASRDCLGDLDRSRIDRVMLASTSHPFADRQNAGVVKEALNLTDAVSAVDFSGSQRTGTAALLDAFYCSRGGGGSVLCVASEKRRAQPASDLELTNGNAAAAFLVGEGEVAAEFLGGYSTSVDFVDHFRSAGHEFDYGWESRWVRDEGYAKIAPAAIKAAFEKLKIVPSQVNRFVMAAPMRGVNASVAKAVGIPADRMMDALSETVGDAGAAHAPLMLAQTLETAATGDIIVAVGFGQGCDVIVLRATERASAARRGLGVSGWLARRRPETNYLRYLAFNRHIDLEKGMRAEVDQKTALTALYRQRKATFALVGGRCSKTGTVQFPKTSVSVSQAERTIGTQEDYPLADRRARIVSHTADSLTYSPDPPCTYGYIEFEGGGKLMVEFVDLSPSDVEVGGVVRMMFRIRAMDESRGFTKYFWKAVPDYQAQTPRPASRP